MLRPLVAPVKTDLGIDLVVRARPAATALLLLRCNQKVFSPKT